MIYQSSQFYNDNNPKELTDEDKRYDVNVQIHKQRIKLYVTIELIMKRNLNNVYGLVWVEFTHSLKSMIKHEKYYKDKSNTFDILWLLNQLK